MEQLSIPVQIVIAGAAIILSIVISTVVTFYITKHGLSDKIRDAKEEADKKIHAIEIEFERLKARDNEQENKIAAIAEAQSQYVPRLFGLLEQPNSLTKRGTKP